ncbi:MAG TPA: hypothetical protein VGK59_03445 [Ohtaekwangia sp.]
MKSPFWYILIVIILTGALRLKAQNCEIFTSQLACAGLESELGLDCYTEISGIKWFVNGVEQPTSSSGNLKYVFPAVGSYTVKAIAYHPPGTVYQEVESVFQISSPISAPQISASQLVFCQSASSVTLSVTNPQPGATYHWSSIPADYNATGTSVTLTNLPASTRFQATWYGCSTQASNQLLVDVIKTSGVLSLTTDGGLYHARVLSNSAVEHFDYLQKDDPNGTDKSITGKSSYVVTELGTYYLRRNSGSCWANASAGVSITQFNYTPPALTVSQYKRVGYNEINLTNSDKNVILEHADIYWVEANNSTTIVDNFFDGFYQTRTGANYLRARDKDTGTWGPTTMINVELLGDQGINSVLTKAFDGTSITQPYAESKSYFDDAGRSLQTQVKVRRSNGNVVLASQNLFDRLDRPVGKTLTAPILASDFGYTAAFIQNTNGNIYGFRDFDLVGSTYNAPLPVGTKARGTLGWYYSNNNDLEPYTPKTNYPYARSDFYQDGTGEQRKSGDVGDILRFGNGHEVASGTFPVRGELNDYLTKRAIAIPGIQQDGSLMNEAVQSVSRDANGRYAVSITDKSGNSVMSALVGTEEDHTLSVVSNISYSEPSQSKYAYFYILTQQPVTISPTTVVEDILNDIRNEPGEGFEGSDGKWATGFYRIRPSAVGENASATFTTYFKDVSYSFYNDAGRLVSVISPNGQKQLVQQIPYENIDKTTYKYNFRGWLTEITEPDAGITKYRYRNDGKIRYSQNAQQRVHENDTITYSGKGRFSYTNYDKFGRPLESGEYIGTEYTFASITVDDQIDFNASEKKHWVKTCYDFADNSFIERTDSIPNTEYQQQFLDGAVSVSENINTYSWYSYDELGRVVWMVQKPKAFSRTFVVKYTYDFLGNVLTVSNLAYAGDQLTNQFYHHYEYDENKRLSKAYTSLELQGPRQLRATYEYYLHGPLKRIELGDNLQGIDFVYNINGWLTQINHPDKTQDPGGDNNDVFGLILDYYESDINNLFSAQSGGNNHDPMRVHGLTPTSQDLYAIHQPLIRFMPAVETVETTGLQEFSADNPVYQKMLSDHLINTSKH